MATATKRQTAPANDTPATASLPPINIAGVRARNVCSLELLEVDMHGHSVVFSGSNASGKTTALRTFLLGLGQMGGKEIPESVLSGEDEAEIDIDIANAETGEILFNVHRDCSKNVWAPIIVKDAQTGEKRKRPQELMDSFIDHVALKPFEWLDQRSQDQVDSVLRICRVPLPVADVERITGQKHPPVGEETAAGYVMRLSADQTGLYYVQRAMVGREWEQKKKALREQRERVDALGDAPADEVADVGQLQTKRAVMDGKREQRRALERKWDKDRLALQSEAEKATQLLAENEAAAAELPEALRLAQFQVQGTEAEIERLKKRLAQENEAVNRIVARQQGAVDIIAGNRDELAQTQAALAAAQKSALAAIGAIPDPTSDIATIDEQIRTISQRQEQIARRKVVHDEFERLRLEEADAAQAHAKAELLLTELRDLRRHLLDNVDLGVRNLTVGDGELRLKDVPFKEQASKSEQLRVAYTLARLRNPRARFMFLDDAERFDAMGRAGLLKDAARDGIQMILAVVRDNVCTSCNGKGGQCEPCGGTGRINAPLEFQVV